MKFKVKNDFIYNGKKYKKNDVIEVLSFSNYKIAKEYLIKKINKLLKKYPIKKIKINKNDMKFINKREIKNRNEVNK